MPDLDKPACDPTVYFIEVMNAGQLKDVTADRVDMSREVMDKHYDKATKNEQMERREDYLVDV
jgi:hypothetical protein